MMRLLVKALFVIGSLFLLVWNGLFSFYRLDEGFYGKVERVSSGEVVRVFSSRYNFIWQGALINEYRVVTGPVKAVHRFDVLVSIPPITDVNDGRYSITIPATLTITIHPERILDLNILAGRGESMKTYLAGLTADAAWAEFREYVDPVYRRDAIRLKSEEIKRKIIEKLTGSLATAGISLVKEELGVFGLPSNEVYAEGVRYQNELRAARMANDRDMILVKGRLEREKLEQEGKFSFYSGMARLINGNPELLKYIYIDKISGNVSVVISSDKEMVPDMLRPEPPKKIRKDIDNLR